MTGIHRGATTRVRRPLPSLAIAAAVAALALVGGSAVVATPAAAAPAGDGWIRFAHLSPDTPAVDITFTATDTGTAALVPDGVAFGAVTTFAAVPGGDYRIEMRRAGADATAVPVLSAPVSVVPGSAGTVAVLGSFRDLTPVVFPDDLTQPAVGQARLRVIQASTIAPTVTVATDAGDLLFDRVEQGTASGYLAVPAGPWDLSLTAPGQRASASVVVEAGSSSTMFVVDNAARGLTVMLATDSAAASDVMRGGIQTGGGWLATRSPESVLR